MATELRREPADVVMADFALIGALAAAEATHVPAAALVHVTYPFPAPGLPPSGYDFLPARYLLGTVRDGLANTALGILRRDGLPFHNRARQQLACRRCGRPWRNTIVPRGSSFWPAPRSTF